MLGTGALQTGLLFLPVALATKLGANLTKLCSADGAHAHWPSRV